MYCFVLESSIFNWAISRSSLRVFERIRLLHFRICLVSAAVAAQSSGETYLSRRIWLPEDSLDRLHTGYKYLTTGCRMNIIWGS